MFPSKFSSVSWFICFFQPRLFYFYHACICVFVTGFHHTPGNLWLLTWIPCMCVYFPDEALPLWEWLVLRRTSFGVQASMLAAWFSSVSLFRSFRKTFRGVLFPPFRSGSLSAFSAFWTFVEIFHLPKPPSPQSSLLIGMRPFSLLLLF